MLQPVFAQYNWTELDAELQAKQKLLGENVVAMIWKDGAVIYKKEMGDFNSTTVAPIASCSKWLTAALVMQFVDEGKLSLDDKVARYIPAFEKNGKGDITIRHCLSHMTGIEDEGSLLKRLMQRRKLSSLEEEVNSFALRNKRAAPGTDFWYGNIGLNIAGRVLEVISKQNFETLIQTKLFIPLGMLNTSFLSDKDKSPVNPSGGAHSTAEDYMKFLVMMLQDGKYKEQQLLSEDAVEQMRIVQDEEEQIKYAPKAAEGFRYSSGSWAIETESVWKKSGGPVPPGSGKPEKTIAMSLASPGLFGTWPMIDYCRGYAYIVFVKNLLGEERSGVHKEFKKIIDKQIPSNCQ